MARIVSQRVLNAIVKHDLTKGALVPADVKSNVMLISAFENAPLIWKYVKGQGMKVKGCLN